MRSLKRNQTNVWYKNVIGQVEETDEYGNVLGSFNSEYSELKKIMISVSANKGDVSNQTFGTMTDYDRTMSISNTNCEIDENSILWIEQDTEKSHNFIVKKKASSLNETVYAIKQVVVSEKH